LELTPNIINQPIVSSRKVKTSVTVWDGQTVALGGLIREDVQDVEDKLPVLGDIPILGRLFRCDCEDHFKRNLMMFVTAVLIDPAGQRIKAQGSGSPIPDDQAANPILLPPVGN
jgi:general secretion pathway protein D